MKREIIIMDVCGKVAIPSDAANIWMNEMELVELFGQPSRHSVPLSEPYIRVEC